MAFTHFVYFLSLGSIIYTQLLPSHQESAQSLKNIENENHDKSHVYKFSEMETLAQRVEMLENVVTKLSTENSNIKIELNSFKERLDQADQKIYELSSESESYEKTRSAEKLDIITRKQLKGLTFKGDNPRFNSSKDSDVLLVSDDVDSTPGINLKASKKLFSKISQQRNQKNEMATQTLRRASQYRGTIISHKPAFHAYLGNTKNQLSNQHLIFDEIIFTSGDLYNSQSGMVTCRFQGVYVFHHTLYVNNDHRVYSHIVKNGNSIGWAIAIGTTREGIGSVMAVTSLDEGDQVWVQIHDFTPGSSIYGYKTAFSGFMI